MALRFAILIFTAWSATAFSAHAFDDTEAGFEFFEKKVRPVLADHCLDCHNEDLAESELRLDSLAGMLRGGTRGPAIVIGKPNESLMVSAMRHGELLKMPAKQKLPSWQIADIAAWVEMGAPWPNAKPVAVDSPSKAGAEPKITDADRSFWSFVPPGAPRLPALQRREWIQSPVDAFVLRRLEEANFSPAPPANKRTLIRRATFDLIGIPPTPEDVRAFIADDSSGAFARLVDRLLNSPLYGQRWGRHWLDVARYADSNGLDENLAYANAHRYRDYVIRAFNQDTPFDQFIKQQLAGDLFAATDNESQIDHIVATGFLSLGAKMLAEDDPVKMQMDIIDEQVDTVGRAFMGLTLGCARCHDHKFDPISTADYYALGGIFKSTKTMENFKVVARWQERPAATPEAVRARDEHRRKITAKIQQVDQLRSRAATQIMDSARQHLGDYLLAAVEQNRRNERLKNATVHGNDPRIAERSDTILIEAEDFDHGNVLKDFTNYGRSIGVILNHAGAPKFTEYDVQVEQAGLYQLEIRVAAAAARPCKLTINGELVKADAAGSVTGGWHPDNQRWFVEGHYPLRKGRNSIRLDQPGVFPHIDKLLLVKSAASENDHRRLAPLDASYEPVPSVVMQWANYLRDAASEQESPLAAFHSVAANGNLDNLSDLAADILDSSTPCTVPNLRELAELYQSRCISLQKPAVANGTANEFDTKLKQLVDDPNGPFSTPEDIESSFDDATVAELAKLREEKRLLDAALPQLAEAMSVSDGTPEDIRIHIRGSHLTRGRTVGRRFPPIISIPDAPSIPEGTSGRRELAIWLTSASHPLTARVIVNRIWLWHFGEGLVRSPDNFGRLGQPPTHPELLDWLSTRFMETGWSIKELHRLMMLSSTYQMSTAFDQQAATKDPDNKLWWRMNRRRLEAEQIRDAILAVSGELDHEMGGTMLPTKNRAYVTSTANVNPVVYKSNRRSVYLPIVRSALYDVFQAFDFADPSVLSGQRQATTVPPQALFMMNSEFVAARVQALADHLLRAEADESERVRRAYERVLGRTASDNEIRRASQFLSRYANAVESDSQGERRRRAWQGLCRALLSSNEFIYVE